MIQGMGKFSGLVAGLVFGVLWITINFADAVLVLVIGLIGLYIGGLATGEISLRPVLDRIDRSRAP